MTKQTGRDECASAEREERRRQCPEEALGRWQEGGGAARPMSRAEWIAVKLGGHAVVSANPAPQLLEDGWDRVIGALDGEARAAGLSDLQLSVLIHLAARAVLATRRWGYAEYEETAVRMSATRMEEYFGVAPERVLEAERSLADEGWIEFDPEGGWGHVGVFDLWPLLSRWEELCCLVEANMEMFSAAQHLRSGLAWRAVGLGKECDLDEVPALSEFATLDELTGECERLLQALDALPRKPAGAVTGWLQPEVEEAARMAGRDGARAHAAGRRAGQETRMVSYWLAPDLVETVEAAAGMQELTPSEWMAGVLAPCADAADAMTARGRGLRRDEIELPRGQAVWMASYWLAPDLVETVEAVAMAMELTASEWVAAVLAQALGLVAATPGSDGVMPRKDRTRWDAAGGPGRT